MNQLKDLNQIDWESISHAYGSAGDIPQTINALLLSEEESNEAMDYLFSSIWHQGTVYEATSYAVPFLAKLLESQQVTDHIKIGLVHLLSSILEGASYWDVHYKLQPEDHDKYFADRGTTFDLVVQEELKFVAKARKSVVDQLSIYKPLLHHSNPELRYSIIMFLGSFPEQVEDVQELLIGLYSEQEFLSETKPPLLESLRSLGFHKKKKLAFFKAIFKHETRFEFKSIASLAILEMMGEKYEQEVFDYVISTVDYLVQEEIEFLYDEPWRYLGSVTGLNTIAKSIIKISSKTQINEFSMFIQRIIDEEYVYDFVKLFLVEISDVENPTLYSGIGGKKDGKWVFKYPMPPFKKLAIDVSRVNEYKKVLEMIIQLDLYWQIDSNLLNVFGFPHSKIELIKLIS